MPLLFEAQTGKRSLPASLLDSYQQRTVWVQGGLSAHNKPLCISLQRILQLRQQRNL